VSDRKIGSSGFYLSYNVEKRFKTGDDDDDDDDERWVYGNAHVFQVQVQ
jgi:hypothetical protein